VAHAHQRRAAAAAAPTTWAMTATAPVTWTVALWMPAASPQTAWRSVWSAAASASLHREACAGVDQRVSEGDNWTPQENLEGHCCCCHVEFSNRQGEQVCLGVRMCVCVCMMFSICVCGCPFLVICDCRVCGILCVVE